MVFRQTILFLVVILPIVSKAHTAIDSLAMFHEATALNSGKIQQEMIYLHLDNTSYYRGDRIFFACYLVTSGHLKPSNLSQTVYVELLNPNGRIIDRCVLKSVDGRCHGSLLADETPFYSGYYEIRAYTRYMLNFGPEAIYSRVIPIFAEPEIEGDWSDRRMLKYGHKKHQFSRPKPVKIVSTITNDTGIDISVDNNSDTVNISIVSTKYSELGASLTCRGELCGRAILDLTENHSAEFAIPRRRMPTGVIQLTLFNAQGQPVDEQLFFNNRHDFIAMEYEFDKKEYKPFEPVELTVKLSKPMPFSLSIADAAEHVETGSDIQSDLLLAPELRGFVPNLKSYLEHSDSLLGALGRYRYSWNKLAGMEPIDILQMPEQGIEVRGSVQGAWRNKGKQGVTVTAMINSMKADSTEMYINDFETDSLGQFAFRTDHYGDWMLSLSATEKGKRKRHRILLDRSERPAARAYDVEEMQYHMANAPIMFTDSIDNDDEAFLKELERKGVKRLKEVKVTADGGHATDVRQYVENAVTSYDVVAARNLLQDRGKKGIRRVSDIMPLIDPNFIFTNGKLLYGTKEPLYVIDDDLADNDKILEYSDIDSSNPADLSVDMVKTIYVNTQPEAIYEYAIKHFENNIDIDSCFLSPELQETLSKFSPSSARDIRNRDFRSYTFQVAIPRIFGCVLFVELNSNNAGFIRPGMRRTIIEGYTEIEEFRHPDYNKTVPIEPDYRRTLYWNPMVIPDSNGIAHIRFYNNSTAKSFHVSAATVSAGGKLGSL